MLLASPAIDYQLHNSLFLVAHFHTMVIGGALFGIFAGITFWFPKVTGFKLNETIGKWAFWFWLVGFFVSFVPLYVLGFLGATRRLDHYDVPGWQPLFITAGIGLVIIACGVGLQLLQIFVSYKQRKQNRDLTGDPWNGRTLEWATSSPPPHYNFAVIPKITDRDAFWVMKEKGIEKPTNYQDIIMAKGTAYGMYVSAFVFLLGFAFVWHILWLGIVGFVGAIVCVVMRSYDRDTEHVIKASEIKKIEEARNA